MTAFDNLSHIRNQHYKNQKRDQFITGVKEFCTVLIMAGMTYIALLFTTL